MNTFKTGDLHLAAFLKTAGVPWKDMEPDSRKGRKRRFLFVFEDENQQVSDLKRAYFRRSSDSKVVALTFAQEISALKSATMSEVE